ncbi:hypothetical protein M9458_019354, partial [Cirrhinus mrigala]
SSDHHNFDRMSSEDPFQESVDTLRRTILSTHHQPPPPPAPTPTRAHASNPEVNNSSSPPAVVCPMVRSTPFSGAAGDCKGFLLQCSITFATYPSVYSSDSAKIGYVISCLTGSALRWAESVWSQAGPAVSSFSAFARHFMEVFGRTDHESSAGEELYNFRQNDLSVHEYTISGWNEKALVTTFRQGLEPNLHLMLAPYDDSIGLERFIQLYILQPVSFKHCNECSPSLPILSPWKLIDDVLLRKNANTNHQGTLFILWTIDSPVKGLFSSTILPMSENMQPFSTPVTLTANDVSISVAALIDSGSAGNFIAGYLARRLKIETFPTKLIYRVQSITGKPLSERDGCVWDSVTKRRCPFWYWRAPKWILHEPILSWGTGEILNASPTYHSNHHVTSNPIDKQSIEIPTEYSDFQDVFCPRTAAALPPHRPWDCAIDLLPDAQVPKGRIYPLSIPETKAMEEYIQEALAHGYIRPSTSPAASSFFFVAKKDGGLRPCIDYRALNKVTIPFKYPLPLVPAALEKLRGAKVFTKLDLRSAYNLVRIRQGDEWKTAFITPTGHYEYLIMPYGLANAPSVFQDFMHEIFREYLDKFLVIYIDDILIYSPSLQDHRLHVRKVLSKLREFHLFLMAEKCTFHQSHTQFLGYHIDASGVSMDNSKIEAIVNWPAPSTVKELQRFLGFSNFYRRFINNFSILVSPLTSLLKGKPRTLTWTPEATLAFERLKEAFTSAPILVHPDPQKPFVVEVDASTTGVGAILSQQQGNPPQLKPCAYFSRKFNPAEKNYDISNRELLAIKLALEEWRH